MVKSLYLQLTFIILMSAVVEGNVIELELVLSNAENSLDLFRHLQELEKKGLDFVEDEDKTRALELKISVLQKQIKLLRKKMVQMDVHSNGLQAELQKLSKLVRNTQKGVEELQLDKEKYSMLLKSLSDLHKQLKFFQAAKPRIDILENFPSYDYTISSIHIPIGAKFQLRYPVLILPKKSQTALYTYQGKLGTLDPKIPSYQVFCQLFHKEYDELIKFNPPDPKNSKKKPTEFTVKSVSDQDYDYHHGLFMDVVTKGGFAIKIRCYSGKSSYDIKGKPPRTLELLAFFDFEPFQVKDQN